MSLANPGPNKGLQLTASSVRSCVAPASHPDSESALIRWCKIMQRQEFTNLETLRATFPTADNVGDFIVFNIGGNKYRLITAIHFNRRKVYIRPVLTHQEYARGA